MKQILTFLGIFIFTSFLSAQELDITSVPAVVLDQFALLYPDARNIAWQEKQGNFRADFKSEKMATMALIAADGILLQTETEIKISALPEPALAYLLKTCGDKKIEEASILADEKGIITFEAQAEQMDYTFDWEGHLLVRNEVVIETREKMD